jgi:serine/threonine-protein kinase SRPK3
MYLNPKPHLSNLAFSISRLFQRQSSSQKKINGSQDAPFPQDVKAIDPKVLAAAMGGSDQPPEEPIFSTLEDGFGYFTDAAVSRFLKQYEFVRKVSM